MLERPFEQWVAFEQNRGNGAVALRMRFVKLYATGLLFVADAQGGEFVGWTLVPMASVKQLRQVRYGKLLYGR